MLKKTISYLATGLAIGSVVAPICLALFNGLDDTLIQVFGWLCASAVYGVSSLIYDSERLSFPAAVGIHGALCYGVTILTCSVLGYAALLGGFGKMALAVLPTFVVIYAAILIGVTAYERRSARAMSEKLKGK